VQEERRRRGWSAVVLGGRRALSLEQELTRRGASKLHADDATVPLVSQPSIN